VESGPKSNHQIFVAILLFSLSVEESGLRVMSPN